MTETTGRQLVLVKHALPVLDASRPAREWRLGPPGEAQALGLAERLRPFLPFDLASSAEPKALRTAGIIGAALGVESSSDAALGELDRPALPIMSPEEHERFNARLFTAPQERVVGAESARAALDRFSAAVSRRLQQQEAQNVVIVSHGTVIALLVAAYNPVEAFQVWKRLQCADFVVLDTPSLELCGVADGGQHHTYGTIRER